MKPKSKNVFQFKITLKGVKPAIWRRIQVPESYSFWDLHVAIQDAMGWTDSHLHEFDIVNPRTGDQESIGIPSDDDFDDAFGNEILPGWERAISKYFSPANKTARYLYDFGDCWEHAVVLEKTLPLEKGVKYPVCLDGNRASPPEDVGGVRGYEEFLDAIKDPKHERHDELLEWVGGEFDPEEFDPSEIHFDDPRKRLKNVMEPEL